MRIFTYRCKGWIIGPESNGIMGAASFRGLAILRDANCRAKSLYCFSLHLLCACTRPRISYCDISRQKLNGYLPASTNAGEKKSKSFFVSGEKPNHTTTVD